MSRPRHQKISELFLHACKLKADERPEFLDRVCEGDTELRAEIEERVRLGKGPIVPDGELEEERYRVAMAIQ